MNESLGIELPLHAEFNLWVSGTRILTQTTVQNLFPRLPGSFKNDFEMAVTGTVKRMISWMQSLSKMNNPGDTQAACAACRSLLELRMDLEILKRDPLSAGKWKAYLLPRRYKAGKQLAELADKHVSLKTDIAVSAAKAYIDDAAIKAKVDSEVQKHWNGKTPNHWSGEHTIFSVAEKLGADYEQLYRTTYYKTSDHLHPGPGGPLFANKKEIAQVFCYCHLQAQRFFGQAMIDAIELLGGISDAGQIKRTIEWAMLSAVGQVSEWKEAIQREIDRQCNEK